MEQALERKAPVTNLQLQTYGQLVKLTKGQKILLETIKKCIESKTVLDWDLIVAAFIASKDKPVTITKWNYTTRSYYNQEVDVMHEYQTTSVNWTYGLRLRVKSWFLQTIGILVIKNQLMIIPVINVE